MASRATSSRSGPSGSSSGSSSSSSVSRTRVGKYELGRTLGEGTFAKVKFARNVVNGENVAIKIIDKEKVLRNKMIAQWSRLETEVSMDAARASPCGSPCNGLRSRILQPTCKFRSGQSSNPGAGSPAGAPIPLDQSNLFKREISTMKLIKHPNVIRMLEVMASKTKIYFVLEFVTGGELFDKSPENLLLDANGTLNVSDFGLSALPQQVQEDSLLHSTCGTPNYVAPQVINNKGYDGAKADLWSCGVILFVLMAGYLPFEDSNLASLYKKIFKAEFTCPHWFSASAKKLIKRILDPNPATRITFAEVIENEWFNKGYKAPKYENANVSLDDVDAIFDESGESQKLVVERREEGLRTPVTRNAFELISTSKGLNLGSLFEKQMGLVKMKTQFTSKCPANEIVTKIEAAAEPMGFDVKKNNYKLVGEKSGRKGQLAVTTEVFQVAPSLYMVEMRKSGGDTLEFHKFYKNLTTGLKDIVWKTIDEVKEEGTQVSGGAVVAS